MSLTKEDLQAISDLIDLKLDDQDKKIQKRFDEQDEKFNKRFDEQDRKFIAIDKRFDEQEEKFDKKLDDLKVEFKEMLIDNNLLIAEHIQKVVYESEERLSKNIQEIKIVTSENCYEIAYLKTKIS